MGIDKLNHLKIKIGCTPEELVKAQRLRHEIFNIEMQSGAAEAHASIDHDRFDDICDHIIIIDEDKDAIVGTYRLLLGSVAAENNGFYSETKFHLDPVKRLKGGMLEVGRACIQKDYRRGKVLNLLWQGIAHYCKERQVRYIFGCASIMTADPRQISEYYCMLKALGLVKQMGIEPADKTRAIALDETIAVENPKKIFLKLPVLFKGYMSLGLKVCSCPVEGNFGSAIFFVLLDMADMNKSYKRRFLGDYLNEPSSEKS